MTSSRRAQCARAAAEWGLPVTVAKPEGQFAVSTPQLQPTVRYKSPGFPAGPFANANSSLG